MTHDRQSLRHITINAIAEIMEIEPGTVRLSDRVREDLGMDSLGSLELLSTLGESFQIDLEIEGALELVTVEDACDFVERSYVAQRGALSSATEPREDAVHG